MFISSYNIFKIVGDGSCRRPATFYKIIKRGELVYTYIIKALINILELGFFFLNAYYLAISVYSLLYQKKSVGVEKLNHFAVVIPAHNEESVIAELLDSIRCTDYKKELISVFVVADGCIDKTAYIARNMGAYVIDKDNSACKGDALRVAFDYIKEFEYDCVAIFDADNRVHKNFFLRMNEKIEAGEQAVQGYIDSKNPNSSWVSNAHSIWYWITNRLVQIGRAKLKLGCRIGGTGFVLTKSLIENVAWDTETLAEDAEYTCMLAFNNIKVDYCEDAIVYDEKPTEFKQSVNQRKRWTQGMRDVQGEYTFKLLKAGKINALLGLWADFLYPLSFFVILGILLFSDLLLWSGLLGKTVTAFYLGANIVTAFTGLVMDKKLSFKLISNLFGFLLYILSWLPVGFWGLIARNNGKWSHTKHGTL